MRQRGPQQEGPLVAPNDNHNGGSDIGRRRVQERPVAASRSRPEPQDLAPGWNAPEPGSSVEGDLHDATPAPHPRPVHLYRRHGGRPSKAHRPLGPPADRQPRDPPALPGRQVDRLRRLPGELERGSVRRRSGSGRCGERRAAQPHPRAQGDRIAALVAGGRSARVPRDRRYRRQGGLSGFCAGHARRRREKDHRRGKRGGAVRVEARWHGDRLRHSGRPREQEGDRGSQRRLRGRGRRLPHDGRADAVAHLARPGRGRCGPAPDQGKLESPQERAPWPAVVAHLVGARRQVHCVHAASDAAFRRRRSKHGDGARRSER